MEERKVIQNFEEIYSKKIFPSLEPLEHERITARKNSAILTIIAIAFCVLAGYLYSISNMTLMFVAIVIAVILFIIGVSQLEKVRAKLKKEVLPKILSSIGNIFFTPNQQAISLRDIHSFGLYPASSYKTNDDVFVGIHKDCNFIINECSLTHKEDRYYRDNKNEPVTKTITDFRGLILKLQMKKNFTGLTVLGPSKEIERAKGTESVTLESINFMKDRKIYSTDQIEARYILTTSFMERLDNITYNFKYCAQNTFEEKSIFSKLISSDEYEMETDISAAFYNGYAYIFVPVYEDLFEVDTSTTLLDSEKYYQVYKQIRSILELIELLNLDKNLGL